MDVPHWQDEVLAIEPVSMQHLDLIIALRSDPAILRFTAREPFANREAAEQFLQQKVLDEVAAGRACNWVIRERASGTLIGSAGVWRIDRANDIGELGYSILPTCWGKGHAGRALAPMLDHVFAAQALHRVEANVDPRNVQSAAVVKKLGFRHEASFRENYKHGDAYLDSDIYALLHGDWLSRRP
ncbi:MAG: GNAT family N-acetyltransferase [Pseudomonadota bacterium]